MNKLLDLRFVIGLFFIITGALLTGYYFFSGKSTGAYPAVNLWCGAGFLAFGALMVLMSGKSTGKE
ncbi:MAG: hypothetical protein JNM68_05655 [Dinghuibacter sp.]|nr:hypothetical protein [Dinghuibacter sp.]